MPKLIIQDNLGVKPPVARPINAGLTSHEALQSNFKQLPADSCRIYINNVLALPTDNIMAQPLKTDDVLTVVIEAKKFIENIVSGVFDLAGDVVGFILDPLLPDVPTFDTAQKSPNNNFTSPTNIIRPFAQKAVVVGSPVIYPDLIGEAIEYYAGNVKRSEQYFYACFGELDGGVEQAGNTRFTGTSFDGATVTRYLPVSGTTTIPAYRVGKSVDEVDGQIIKGANEGDDGTSYLVTADSGAAKPVTAATLSGGTFTYYVNDDVESQALNTRFGLGAFNCRVEYNVFEVGGPTLSSGEGVVTNVVFEADNGVHPDQYAVTVSSFDGPESTINDYNGSGVSPFTTIEILPAIIGPFANPVEAAKMFFNIQFQRGLKGTADIRVVVYELDAKGGTPTGLSETFTVSYTQDSLDEYNQTFEINIANGSDWYEFTVERTNNASKDTQQPDIPKLEKVFCIDELGDTDFDNATMFKVVMPATQVPTGRGVENKINIVGGQVKMPSYDTGTQTITANAASRKAADAVLFLWRDFYGKDPADLNLDELYEIQDRLDAINPEYAQFDYTFDDVETGLNASIDIILNVMRVNKYNDGNQIRFWRDEEITTPTNLLGRRDMVPESERDYSITKNMFVGGDKDSIQIEYIDRSINKKAYVYRSISGGTIQTTPGANLKKITMLGCQSQLNADNRADLEIRKLLYQRWTLSDTFMDTQKLLDRGAVVRYEEIYEGGDSFGGQVVDINGNTVTTDSKLDLTSGPYIVYFTDLLGSVLGPFNVTPVDDFNFTSTSVNGVYRLGFDNSQIGSRYFITQTSDTIKRTWRVIDKSSSGYNVQIGMVNYDSRIYENDPS